MRFARRYMPLIVLGWVLLFAGVATACPNCKNSLPDSDDPGMIGRLRDGYFWSYVGMSSMPFIAVGTIGTKLYRRLKAAEEASEADVNVD